MLVLAQRAEKYAVIVAPPVKNAAHMLGVVG
jgi:hypothetical protein